MSVNWSCGNCEAHKIAHKAAMVSGEFDYTVKEWDEYTDLRESLIWALLVTKFPANDCWSISEKNWKEVYIRLHQLEKVRGSYRIYSVPSEDDPTKIDVNKKRTLYFTPSEVHSMIGMEVNAGNLSDAKWKTLLHKMLKEDATMSLNRWEKDNAESE